MKRLLLLVLLAAGPWELYAQAPLAKLVDDAAQKNNAFGDVVALDGDHVAVGAFLDTNSHGEKAGAAYVFRREGETWVQEAQLVGSGVSAEDRFGIALDIDGDRLLVANRAEAGGTIYVYQRVDDTWTEQGRLTVNDQAPGEELGTDVIYEDPYAFINGSSIRVFKREGDEWTHQAKLTTETGETLRLLAASTEYVIGAWTFNNGRRSVHEVVVFKRDGETWTQQAHIVPTDLGVAEFRSAAAALDGEDLVIGARVPNTPFNTLYVFKADASGWVYQTEFTTQDPSSLEFNAAFMAMNDGLLLVGDSGQDARGDHSGAVYVFRREGDAWRELPRIVPEDGRTRDRFGIDLDINDTYMVIGQDGHQIGDNTEPSGFGGAYIYAVTDIIATHLTDVPLPSGPALSAPYPNPFRTRAAFTLRTEQPQQVRVAVYDLLGRLVQNVFEGPLPAQSPHPFTVDARNWPAGVYLLQVQAGGGRTTHSLYVVR